MLRIFRGAGLDFAPLVGRDTQTRAYPRLDETTRPLRSYARASLEMLVRRAVVALGEWRSLTRLALACRRAAARNATVKGPGFDLRLDERAGCSDSFADRPGDLGLGREHWKSGLGYALAAVGVVASVIVVGVLMPSEFSSHGSIEDSERLGKNLGIELLTIPITEPFHAFKTALKPAFKGAKPDVTEDHPLVPLTLYNKYKGMCEPLLKKHTDKDFTGVMFRPATVCGYAPRLRLDLTVNILTSHAINNNRITVFGGDQLRPNIHVEDMSSRRCKGYTTQRACEQNNHHIVL